MLISSRHICIRSITQYLRKLFRPTSRRLPSFHFRYRKWAFINIYIANFCSPWYSNWKKLQQYPFSEHGFFRQTFFLNFLFSEKSSNEQKEAKLGAAENEKRGKQIAYLSVSSSLENNQDLTYLDDIYI